MDYATQLLKTHFNCQYGMHQPSYLYSLAIARDRTTTCPEVPCHQNADKEQSGNKEHCGIRKQLGLQVK